MQAYKESVKIEANMDEKRTILLAIKYCPHQDSIKTTLKSRYNVLMTGTAKATVNLLNHRSPHMVLVDFNMDGVVMIKSLRKIYDAPIIVLLENVDANTIVDALDAGANDVLILPFGSAEHLARIRAALRFNANKPRSISEVFSANGLVINYGSREVTVNGCHVHLTPIEFRIMTFLCTNAGQVLSHDQIINEVWGPYNSDNLVLRVNIANIRRKIETNPAEPKYIVTEAGVGYRVISD